MPHILARAIEILTTVLAAAGIGYFLASIVAARIFLRERRAAKVEFAPGVSILKSLKGLDPGMMDAFRSHCRQSYAGEFELLFGASSLDDPAAAAVKELVAEFPECAIRLIECPERLGTNGKVSTLVQLARQARYDVLLINDSDITVGQHYLERVISCLAPADAPAAKAPSDSFEPDVRAEARTLHNAGEAPVGLVTALYRGRAHGAFWRGGGLGSRLESLGIATDFIPGVLVSKWIEDGLHYGLGSTLAVRREALEKSGGLLALVDQLADDYEMGTRVAHAGYRVALSAEVVETSVPAYDWRGFVDHQLRWLHRPGRAASRIHRASFYARFRMGAREHAGERIEPGEPVAPGIELLSAAGAGHDRGRRGAGRSRCACVLVAAAAARRDCHGPMGSRLCRKHDCVARRTVRIEGWPTREYRADLIVRHGRVGLFQGADGFTVEAKARAQCIEIFVP